MFHIYDSNGVCARCGFNSIAFRERIESEREAAKTEEERRKREHAAKAPMCNIQEEKWK